MPSLAGGPKNTDSYVLPTGLSNSIGLVYFCVPVLIGYFLALAALVMVYTHIKSKIKAEDKNIPKAYFQFWAAHISGLAYLFASNIHNFIQPDLRIEITSAAMVVLLIASGLLFAALCLEPLGSLRIPVQWLCRSQCRSQCCSHCCTCERIIGFFTTIIVIYTITLAVISIPNIIFIFYLYPARSLVRLPLLINAALYVNSLLALLIYQFERSCYACKKRNEGKKDRPRQTTTEMGVKAEDDTAECDETEQTRLLNGKNKKTCCQLTNYKNKDVENKNYEDFYEKDYEEIESGNERRLCIGYWILTGGIAFILISLILFIWILSDLLTRQHNSNQDDQLKLLLTLIPNLILLFGSWYKIDLFFFVEEESEKSLLKKLLRATENLKVGMDDLLPTSSNSKYCSACTKVT
jgi:uncharacterized membrane protein